MNGQAALSHANAHPAADTPAKRGFQRTCGSCGQHLIGGGICERCERRSGGPSDTLIPPSVENSLQSAGQPLTSDIRERMTALFSHEFSHVPAGADATSVQMRPLTLGPDGDAHEQQAGRMERYALESERLRSGSHSGPDFSHVRVHVGTQADQSAREMNAQAYTVGQHIVFAAGQYRPEIPAGQALLSHELTHVLQQQSSTSLQRRVQRKGGTFGGFFRNLGRAIASIFTDEPKYDLNTLQKYLQLLDNTGDIEDDFDSDNKARAAVNLWKEGSSNFSLTEQRKALLIREMLSGFTGDDDEQAILNLLERSYNFELNYIFGPGGVTAGGLNSAFQGQEWEFLKSFYDRRFVQGYEGVQKGNMTPTGFPVELGDALPYMNQDNSGLLPGAGASWTPACVMGILCSEDQSVVSQLPKFKVVKASLVIEVYWQFEDGKWVKKERERGAFNNSGEGRIGLKEEYDCGRAASSIIHEVRHSTQPDTWTALEKERDAYTFEADWDIQRGIKGFKQFRANNPKTGKEEVNKAEIETYVRNRYSGISAGASPEDQITGHTGAGTTVLERPDGGTYERPSQEGDSHQDVGETKKNLDNLPVIDPALWVCPAPGKPRTP